MMEQYKEEYNKAKQRNEDFLDKVAELGEHIKEVEESISRKRQRIEEHKEKEMKYIKLNQDIKKPIKSEQISKENSQQLSNNASSSSPEFISEKIEKLIERQYTLKEKVPSESLENIQSFIKNMLSTDVDYPKQLSLFLHNYSTKIKNENKRQRQQSDDDIEKKAAHKKIKTDHAEKVSKSKRLLHIRDLLEQETKEAELKLIKKIRSLYDGHTIQDAVIKSLRLKAACKQVTTELDLTKAQVEILQSHVQELKAKSKASDLSISINGLVDTVTGKQLKTQSLVKTNIASRQVLLDLIQKRKESMKKA